MSAKTAASRKAKGRRAAQEVKDLLTKYAPDLEHEMLVTPSGVTGPDVLLTRKAFEKFPLPIETKNCESLNIWKAFQQAESHSKHYDIYEGQKYPCLFFRRNRSELMVTLKAEDFVKLIA